VTSSLGPVMGQKKRRGDRTGLKQRARRGGAKNLGSMFIARIPLQVRISERNHDPGGCYGRDT